jgi:hypothetical protein
MNEVTFVLPLTLTLPLPPNLANSRMHWRKKNRERRDYLAICDEYQLLGLVPPPPRSPLDGVTLASVLHCWAIHDDDNALSRGKWAYDWLKTRGYIVDDKRPHCRFTIPEQVIDRKDQRLVLTLTPEPP